jgi:uncharacterized membrane protein
MSQILTEKLDGVYNALRDSYNGSPYFSSIIAATLASIGLATDSTATVIGSMLISPIGTFIVQSNLYHFLKRNNYKMPNLKYSPWYVPVLLVIVTTIVISYLIGKLFIQLNDPFTKEPLNKNWPTNEMMMRSEPMAAVYSIPVALLCGIILPLIVINKNASGFVAVGIATSLIPPLANIGLALNFQYNPVVHAPHLKDYKTQAILTSSAIFAINVILLLLPSKFLMKTFLRKNHIFEKVENFFSF